MQTARSWTATLAAAVACACAIGLLAAGFAGAEEPNSMGQAVAMDDPAAAAPTFEAPAIYYYNGEQISEDKALGLACMQNPRFYDCKDSASEFDEAASSKARKGGKATASAACGVTALWLYQHKQYTGIEFGLGWFGGWYDVPSSLNNETTAYRTGEGRAHLSDFSGGGGYWYPGPTGVCDYHSNISQPYPQWNDRISSRYRY